MPNNKKRIGIKIGIILLSFLTIFCIVSLLSNKETSNRIEYGKDTSYISDQFEIKNSTKETSNIKMVGISEFYNKDSNGIFVSYNDVLVGENDVITISTGLELDAFSKLCNSVDKFLSYKYKLINDIDYSEASNKGLRFIPVGWKNISFSGEFDGQGFEISNLFLLELKDTNSSDYNAMKYLSMFSMTANSSSIKNLGLINTDIVQTRKTENIIGVSPLVGYNAGTINKCYVVDVRDAAKRKGGISASGGYSISGFCYENAGVINNVYTDYSILVNYIILDYIDFRELVNNNTGTITNAYFYNHSIDFELTTLSNYSAYKYNTGKLTYSSGLVGITLEATGKSIFGQYVKNYDELNSIFYENGWFTNKNYTKISFDLIRPSLKGLVEYDNTGYSFKITSALEFAYIFSLARKNNLFISDLITYVLMNDIDLHEVPSTSYAQSTFFSAKFVGITDYTESSITLMNNTKPLTPTIYGASILNTVKYSGYDCYGLFPLLDGTISNINIYMDETVSGFGNGSSTTTKAIGIVSGYIESGIIDNVNVYGNINLNTKNTGNNFGRYITGGICGILARGASVRNVTTSGSIDGNNHTVISMSLPGTGFAQGNSMGGVIGYSVNNVGRITNCLSAMNLTITSYKTSFSNNQYIGGIIGSGYSTTLNDLANKGNIVADGPNYGNLYIAGVIGRYLGVTKAVSSLHNQGDITLKIAGAQTSYVSGVFNCDIQQNTTISQSKENLVASGLSNSGLFNFTTSIIMSESIANNLKINAAGVAFVMGNSKTYFKGVYNLPYKYTNSIEESLLWERENTKNELNIDISLINEFAPLIVSNASSNIGAMSIEKAYNLTNINYNTSTDLYFFNVNYSGALSGEYMNLKDIKNEGNIKFNILANATRQLYVGGAYKTFKVYGVFEEVSKGFNASNIYNGGDITLIVGDANKTNLNVYYNLYISGICYANRNSFTSITEYQKYNPLSDSYDSSNIGSLDNVINNGDIISSSYTMDNINLGNTTNGTIKGSVYLSGITQVNEGVISSTFNLGNITSKSFIAAKLSITGSYYSPKPFELNSSGIAGVNIGSYAQIRDSANNGNITSINMSKKESFVYSSGIVVKNDTYEDGTEYGSTNNSHHLQLICFTINYGKITTFNYTPQIETSSGTPHTISSGILATGLCSLLNTINYGNIYGSELTSGIFGYVLFYKFADEVTSSNKVTIANSINYSRIYGIATYISVSGVPRDVTYQEVLDAATTHNDKLEIVGIPTTIDKQYGGAVISIISYAGTQGGTTAHANASNIVIRYLINFNADLKAICSENASSGLNAQANDTLFTTKQNDSFMGKSMVYSPLSTIEDSYGNIGVFSDNFRFRLAINGKIESDVLTDTYLSDYFQFVAFAKINTELLESIGWRTLAYIDAASGFARDLNSVGNLLKYYSTLSKEGYDLIVTSALETETWIANCDMSILSQILESILASQNTESLQQIVKYLFFESSNSNSITTEMRALVVEKLVNNQYSTKEDLYKLLNSLLYDDLLAKILTKSDSEYNAILNIIQGNLQELSYEDLDNLVNTYLEYLNSVDNTYYNNLFEDKYSQARQELLISLLSGLDETIYQDILQGIINKAIEDGDTITYDQIALLNIIVNTSIDTQTITNLYTTILSNNGYGSNLSTVITSAYKKFDLPTYISGSTTTVLDSFYTNNASASGTISTTARDYDISGAVDASTSNITNLGYTLNSVDYTNLWNSIKSDSSIKAYLNDILGIVTDINNISKKGIYALATEYRNSYQTQSPKSGTLGRFRSNSQTNNNPTTDTLLTNRFIYTPDDIVNQKTSYLGPFVNASNTMFTYPNHNIIGAQNMKLNVNTDPDTTRKIYAPLFISLDNEFLKQTIIDYPSTGTKNTDTYRFIWNNYNTINSSSSVQWVSWEIINNKPTDNSAILLKNTANTTFGANSIYKKQNGESYLYDFDNDSILSTTGERQVVSGVRNSIVTPDSVGLAGLDTSTFLVAYASAAIITGLYYIQDQWESYGAFLTAKDGGKGVVTTHYIDYSIDDLLNLDGYLTKGRNKNITFTESDYKTNENIVNERSIINILMQKILSTTEGKRIVMNAVGKMIDSGIDSEIMLNVAKSYMNALKSDPTLDFAKNFLLAINNLNESYGLTVLETQTYKDYLLNNYDENTFTDYQKLLMIKDKKYFTYIINYLLDKDIGYYDYLTNETNLSYFSSYDDSEIKIVCDFIDELKQLGKTDSEINSILQENLNTETLGNYVTNLRTQDLMDKTINSVTGSKNNVSFTNVSTKTDYQEHEGEYYHNGIIMGTNSSLTISPRSDIAINSISIVAKAVSSETTLTLGGTSKTISSSGLSTYEWTNLSVEDTISVLSNKEVIIYSVNTYHKENVQINTTDVNWYRIYDSTISSYVLYANKESYITFTNSDYPYIYAKGGTITAKYETNYGTTQNTTFNSLSSVSVPTGYTSYQLQSRSVRNYRVTVPAGTYVYFVTSTNNASGYKGSASYITNNVITSGSNGITIHGTLQNYDYLSGSNPSITGVLKDHTIRNTVLTTPRTINGVTFPASSITLPATNTRNQVNVSVSGASASTSMTLGGLTNSITTTGGSYSFTNSSLSGAVTLSLNQVSPAVSSVVVTSINQAESTPYTSNVSLYGKEKILSEHNSSLSSAINALDTSTSSYTSSDVYVDVIRKYIERVFNPSNLNNIVFSSSIDSTKHFTVINSSDYTITNGSWTKYNQPLTSYVRLVSPGSKTNNSIGFSISNKSQIIVYASSISSTKTLTLNVGDVLYKATLDENLDAYIFNVNVSQQTNCYLYSTDGDIAIYRISVLGSDVTEEAKNKISILGSDFSRNIITTFGSYEIFYRYLKFIKTTNVNQVNYPTKDQYVAFASLFLAGVYQEATEEYKALSNATGIDLWKLLSQENLMEIIKAVGAKDDSGLIELIESSTKDAELREVIGILCQNLPVLLVDVMSEANLTELTEEQTLLFASAYIGSDFYNSINSDTMSSSKLSTILNDIYTKSGEDYKFITSDTTINDDIFINLMTFLEYNLSTDGFGIYALSSSKGILNGEFIPDNISLYNFDSNYENHEVLGFVLLSNETTKSSSWRGGFDNDENNIGDKNSVNYAFYKSMKQLRLSIATNVFDLELVSENGSVIITTPEALINNEDKVISFYVPQNTNESSLRYSINSELGSYKISYNALLETSEDFIEPGDTTPGETSLVVYAEDRTVKATYKVYLYKTADVSMTLTNYQIDEETQKEVNDLTPNDNTYELDGEVKSTLGNIKLIFKTMNIPNFTDLSDKISIVLSSEGNGEFTYNSVPIITTVNKVYDSVNRAWGQGDLIVDIALSDELMGGTHTIKILLNDDISYQVKFTRNINDENSINSIVMNGEEKVFDNNTLTSYITFGRGYTYGELTTIVNNKPSYLDNINVSPRAVVSVTEVTLYKNSISPDNIININTNMDILDDILIYSITIMVKSESGVNNYYTHYLIETDPFEDANIGLNEYDSSRYVVVIVDGETKVHTPNENGTIDIEYAREDENQNELTPSYRFNYYLDKFYYDEESGVENYLTYFDNNKNGVYDDSIYYSIGTKYYGLYVNFYGSTLPGSYTVNLIYENKDISWGDYSITRKKVCPTITITKQLSTDAYLKEIHFLESGGKLADSATIASLTRVTANKPGGNNYSDLIDNKGTDFVSNLGVLSYNNQAALSASEYYIVGTVSGAALSTYAPTFDIKSYSKIYQYKKIGTIRYLYVEFEYIFESRTYKEVFLVDEQFNNVYSVGTIGSESIGEPIGTISNNAFIYNEISYTISNVAGTTDESNTGLNMDYIGYPEEGEFWYVDYVIFAEAYKYDNSMNNCKEYHIAVLDLTNNVRFNFEIGLDENAVGINIQSIYLTILAYEVFTDTSSGNNYLVDTNNAYIPRDINGIQLDDSRPILNKVVSGFATRNDNYFSMVDNDYNVDTFGFQALPYSYFYFYLDLPDGYSCMYEITTPNKTNTDNQWGDSSYLAPTSLVTQTIDVKITIVKSAEANFVWGEKVLAVLSNKATIQN